MSLYEKLEEYGSSDFYGFHMPGHKRNVKMMGAKLPYQIDITEIDGFDDLHHAKEILKVMQERAARLYHAEETCCLINGSTSGILSAILGCTHKGDRILVARNCHKSVYAAMYMNELEATYVYPRFDAKTGLNGVVDAAEIRSILQEDRSIAAVMITSPTYDGVVSDVRAIAAVAHEFQIPLIVDEAHGAHFGFDPYFPENANQCGADVVIHSLHKTLPCLTQTALIHVNGKIVNRKRIWNYVHMLQTSSPSYVLMASMDVCFRFLEAGEGFGVYVERLEKLREELQELRFVRLVETTCADGADYDRSKLVLSTSGTTYSGKQLYEELLETYHLQMEMASCEYVLAMTSVCDTEDGFARLKEALFEIDARIAAKLQCSIDAQCAAKLQCEADVHLEMEYPRLERVMTSAQAVTFAEEAVEVESTEVALDATRNAVEGACFVWRRLEQSAGCVALEYAYVYPPGIPIVVPGERVSSEAVALIGAYAARGFDIEGLEKEGFLKVVGECVE